MLHSNRATGSREEGRGWWRRGGGAYKLPLRSEPRLGETNGSGVERGGLAVVCLPLIGYTSDLGGCPELVADGPGLTWLGGWGWVSLRGWVGYLVLKQPQNAPPPRPQDGRPCGGHHWSPRVGDSPPGVPAGDAATKLWHSMRVAMSSLASARGWTPSTRRLCIGYPPSRC